MRGLARFAKAERVDLIQVHGLLSIDGMIAGKCSKCAIVWQLLDTRPAMSIRRTLMPIVVRTADVVMTAGDALADEYPGCRSLGERLVPFVPPVTSSFRVSEEARFVGRRLLGVGDNEVLVASLGNLNPQKGHDHLIYAARRMCAGGNPVRFVIRGETHAGHEGFAASLRAGIPRHQEASISVGPMEPPLTPPQLLNAADIFVLASHRRSEGLPTAILEAMSVGTPVIATDVGAVREVVSRDAGVLVPPDEPDALFTEVMRLCTDHDLRERLGRNAAARAAGLARGTAYVDQQVRAFALALQTRAGARR
jgi:glycosyltransferase involved in cell wall biosynthesis